MRMQRVGCALASALVVVAAFPAAALGQDDGDAGDPGIAPSPKSISAEPTAVDLARELGDLMRQTVKIAAPTGRFVASPSAFPINDGQVELNTNLADGELKGEVVITVNEVRSVAQIEGEVCPDEGGAVSIKITMSIGSATAPPRSIVAHATGTANDNAVLTSKNVKVTGGKGKEAALLKRFGDAALRQAEQGWQSGLCVTVDVTEGQSQVVKPKQRVPITAVAKPRSGGGPIKGRMESKRTAGQKKVEPSTVSDTPAKFTFTAPDKRPETGQVTLKSISKRGIGTAVLDYTTAGDLKVNSSGVSATKCGGPEGAWSVHFTPMGSGTGDANATFTLAPGTLSGPYAFSGYANTPYGPGPFSESGTVKYVESADGGSGTLAFSGRGSLPVTIGKYC